MPRQRLSGCGRVTFRVPPDGLWSSLLDPETLRAAIPGAVEVERIDAERFRATICFGVGWITGRYTADLVLTATQEPWSLDLSGASRGAFGKGEASAHVDLAAVAGGGARLDWRYQGTVSGPVSLAGRSLLQVASDHFVRRFFADLSRLVNAQPPS